MVFSILESRANIVLYLKSKIPQRNDEVNRKKYVQLFLYSICHFFVDFSCILLLYRLRLGEFGSASHFWWQYALIYNFCAFALQAPFGMILDTLKNCHCAAAFGCFFIGLSWALPLPLMARCIIAGLSNALFHIGGGIQILRTSKENKASEIGIFVSTGAFGVFLGKKLARTLGWLSIVMFVCAAIILIFDTPTCHRTIKKPLNSKAIFASFCLFFTVFIRAVLGGSLGYKWNFPILSVVMVCCIVFGKALGGIIGDIVCWRKTATISLILSAFLYVFSFKVSSLGLVATLLFNMTMPLTVSALTSTLNGKAGLAFGLTTFALFLGTLPSLFGLNGFIFTAIGLPFGCLMSCVLLWIGLDPCLYFKEETKNETLC